MKQLLYVGSSWAVKSFAETDDATDTSIEQECNLKSKAYVTKLCQNGTSNLDMLDKVKRFGFLKYGIVWLYCEPILDIERLGICTREEFLTSPNSWELRSIANKRILQEMNNLNMPIALIGAHSDVIDCDYENITVINNSWQSFLLDSLNYDYVGADRIVQGWGAEVAHRWMAQLGVSPTKELTDKIIEIFRRWSLLIKEDLFWEVHPTSKATKLFAKEIEKPLYEWIDNL